LIQFQILKAFLLLLPPPHLLPKIINFTHFELWRREKAFLYYKNPLNDHRNHVCVCVSKLKLIESREEIIQSSSEREREEKMEVK
jgi:hypothetical protein